VGWGDSVHPVRITMANNATHRLMLGLYGRGARESRKDAAPPRGDARRPGLRRDSGHEQAKAKFCRIESDEVAVAFGPPS
jgi:hypothetical protein